MPLTIVSNPYVNCSASVSHSIFESELPMMTEWKFLKQSSENIWFRMLRNWLDSFFPSRKRLHQRACCGSWADDDDWEPWSVFICQHLSHCLCKNIGVHPSKLPSPVWSPQRFWDIGAAVARSGCNRDPIRTAEDLSSRNKFRIFARQDYGRGSGAIWWGVRR